MQGRTSPLPEEGEVVSDFEAAGFEWECEQFGWGFCHLDDPSLTNIKRLKSIAFLDLFEACDMDEVTDEGLANLVGNTSLVCLRLGPSISDAGLSHLEGLNQLLELRLDNAGDVTDIGIGRLRKLTNLERLSLQYTQIGNASLKAVSHITGLKELVLCHTNITDEGLSHLSAMKQLSDLALSDTAITNAGLQHLKSLTGITSLWLDGTQVTDAGLGHLSEMNKLNTLLLKGKTITDAAIPQLLRFQKLKQLYLTDTGISSSMLEHLEQGLPECDVIS